MTRIFLPASILASSAINSTISAFACSAERPATRSSSTRDAASRASRSAWAASSFRSCSAISRSFFVYSAARASTCSFLRSSWSSFWRRRFSSWLSSFFRSRVSFSKSILTCSRWSLAWRAASFRMFAASFLELWRISAAFSASARASDRALSSVLFFPESRNATYTASPTASAARTAMSTVDIFKMCLLGRSSMFQGIRTFSRPGSPLLPSPARGRGRPTRRPALPEPAGSPRRARPAARSPAGLRGTGRNTRTRARDDFPRRSKARPGTTMMSHPDSHGSTPAGFDGSGIPYGPVSHPSPSRCG